LQHFLDRDFRLDHLRPSSSKRAAVKARGRVRELQLWRGRRY
jgi:hypothetical protein